MNWTNDIPQHKQFANTVFWNDQLVVASCWLGRWTNTPWPVGFFKMIVSRYPPKHFCNKLLALFFPSKQCHDFWNDIPFWRAFRTIHQLILRIEYSYQLHLQPSSNNFKYRQMNNERKTGSLGFIGDKNLRSYIALDYKKPLKSIPTNQPGVHGKAGFFSWFKWLLPQLVNPMPSSVGIWPSTLVTIFVDVLWHVSSRCLDGNRFFSRRNLPNNAQLGLI